MSTPTEPIKTAAELKAELSSIRTAYFAKARAELEAAIPRLFEQYPFLQSVGFKAFAPYFNDGDACVWHLRADEPDVAAIDANGEEYDVWTRAEETTGYGENEKPNPLYDKAHDDCYQAVIALIDMVDEDVWEQILESEHVEVTLTKDGIQTSDYSRHD